jgi:DeoR/GlpR family transcriptional regulator of sugar metabolism
MLLLVLKNNRNIPHSTECGIFLSFMQFVGSEDTEEIAQRYRADKMFFSPDRVTMDGSIPTHNTVPYAYT